MGWFRRDNTIKKEIELSTNTSEGKLKILTMVILKLDELQKILETTPNDVNIDEKIKNAKIKIKEIINLFNTEWLKNNPYIGRINLISNIIEKKIYFPIHIEKTNIRNLISETKTQISMYRNKL